MTTGISSGFQSVFLGGGQYIPIDLVDITL